ncbi:hypothetical protein KP509_07G058000 [Ceratopteris richardii]|uniref:RING-type E3 ubiquitin transferase n=1 Tax=Ceratopteris richardii TaxID=49495 RepID=A0A8T2UCN7_CERRI|nr:hypothetical protein KP509_07G058000 [Ceratopteris richardii]
MVIVLVILLTSFFFMAFLSIYVSRRSSSAEGSPPVRDNDANQVCPNGASPQGLDITILEKLPLVTYSSSDKKGSNIECVVCLTDFEEGETLTQLPKCKHVFHEECINMWLFSNTTCPLCRCSLIPRSTKSLRCESRSGSLQLSIAHRGSVRGSARGTDLPSPADN